MIKKYASQSGIALIQVLLISAILSVLALYLTSTAQEQVQIARWSDDRANALVSSHSAESELLFHLLIQDKNPYSQSFSMKGGVEVNHFVNQWNFFAKPFLVNDAVEVKIQDQAGLLNIHFPDHSRLNHLISLLQDSNETNQIVANILDWQDLDSLARIEGSESQKDGRNRNGAIPDLSDLKNVNLVTDELLTLLKRNTTIHKQGHFNPVNSPLELLIALFGKNIAEEIITLRNSNQLSKRRFTELTGMEESEDVFFFPSNVYEISFLSEVGEIKIHKKLLIQIFPYATATNKPINILSSRG